MYRAVIIGVLLIVAAFIGRPSRAELGPATQPAKPWEDVEKHFAAGELKDKVYTVTIPRKDLLVSSLDLGDIPTAAGLASTFHFFDCPCGKSAVVGQLVLADYEVNDVLDELRGAQLKVSAIAPMFLGDKPRMTLVRFQGEGSQRELARAAKLSLKWTGTERNKVD